MQGSFEAAWEGDSTWPHQWDIRRLTGSVTHERKRYGRAEDAAQCYLLPSICKTLGFIPIPKHAIKERGGSALLGLRKVSWRVKIEMKPCPWLSLPGRLKQAGCVLEGDEQM